MEFLRTATRAYPAGDRLTLTVDSRSGSVTVIGDAAETATVEVTAHLLDDTAESADASLAQIMAGIDWREGALTIITPQIASSGPWFMFGRGVRIDYMVTAPLRTTCRIASRSGRVEVARVEGPVDIEQRSGRTAVSEVALDVAISTRSGNTEVERVGGRLTVTGHSGRVSVRDIGGEVRLGVHSGAIDAERTGGLHVSSHSGSIRADGVDGDLRAEAGSGRISAENITGGVRATNRSGSITVDRAGGPSELKTASGSITVRGPIQGDLSAQTASGGVRLEVDPDYPFFIEAESASGSVSSDLPTRRDGVAAPEDAPRVNVRTASGSIRVTRYVG